MKIISLVFVLSTSSASARAAEPPWFLGIGDMLPQSMSGDGNTVVGFQSLHFQDLEAVRWTAELGIVDLDELNQVGGGVAMGASSDGTVVVGDAAFVDGYGGGFRWENGVFIYLGDLPGGPEGSNIFAVSGDGQTAVGQSYSDRSEQIEAVRWTTSGGLESLDAFFPGGDYASGATDVSHDGSVIVGWADLPHSDGAFRWTEQEGIRYLGDLPGGSDTSHARLVSADGRVIVGISYAEHFYYDAFIWTEETGMLSLYAPDFEQMNPTGISADGAVIVGDAMNSRGGSRPFIWDAERGTRSLVEEMVYTYGIDLGGWKVSSVDGLSDDGRTLCGRGLTPEGQVEAWVAYLGDPILCDALYDLDHDEIVNLSDLALLLANYGMTPATVGDGDFDQDGAVDLDDVAEFLGDFLTPC